jgi:hypothetical protein
MASLCTEEIVRLGESTRKMRNQARGNVERHDATHRESTERGTEVLVFPRLSNKVGAGGKLVVGVSYLPIEGALVVKGASQDGHQ